jgi:hypothetical protein
MANATPPLAIVKKGPPVPVFSLMFAALSGATAGFGAAFSLASYYGVFLFGAVTLLIVLVLSGLSIALAIAWFADGRRAMPGVVAIVCALGLPVLGALMGGWLWTHRAECTAPTTMYESPNKNFCAK